MVEVNCSSCDAQLATALCFCTLEATYLCSTCVGPHFVSEGKHSLHSLRDYEDPANRDFTTQLEKRKMIVLMKSFLSERLKQINTEGLKYKGLLDRLEQDLHLTITNRFSELQRVLDRALEKMQVEINVLQEEIQSYSTNEVAVSPLCEKLMSQSAMLTRFLNEPIGTILTDTSLVEVYVNQLQSFTYQPLNVLIGRGSLNASLYSFTKDQQLSIFDPETETSTKYQLPPQDFVGWESSWCALQNNDVFVCGGVMDMQKLASAAILRTAIINLEEISPMSEARSTHGVVELNGFVYVFGGEGSSRAGLNSAESYHIDMKQWTDIKPLPAPLVKVSAVAVKDGIYLTGFNTYQIIYYCPDKNAYKPIMYAFDRSYQSSCFLSYIDRLLILRGSDVLTLGVESDSELTFQCRVPQTGKNYIWEIKGSPLKAEKHDLMYYYVFNYSTQSVFEIFMYGTRVTITEEQEAEDDS